MANPHRGEVSISARDTTYLICFTINAMCELEALTGRSIVEIAMELETVQKSPATLRMSTLRAVTWAALRQHHPEITEQEAGEVLAEAGFPVVMKAVLAAIHAAFPAAQPGSPAGKGASRAKARPLPAEG